MIRQTQGVFQLGAGGTPASTSQPSRR